jgi:hypothetical protein
MQKKQKTADWIRLSFVTPYDTSFVFYAVYSSRASFEVHSKTIRFRLHIHRQRGMR